MKTKVCYRKGGKQKRFVQIVEEVVRCLNKMKTKGRIKEQLLSNLNKGTNMYSSSWQDGDELHNLLGATDHRFDVYNWRTSTAIEIEESEVKYIWKDLIKFSVGKKRGKVINAILICPFSYRGKTLRTPIKLYDNAINYSRFMSDLLWVKNLAIIGYEK